MKECNLNNLSSRREVGSASTNLPTTVGFLNKLKHFWADINKPIVLTPKQEKVFKEVHDFLFQEITFPELHAFLFSDVGKKKNKKEE